jgi:2-succinyl-5-enolpyruvyl-6-hydroxy-3-cyclohexene-1-carboxylate synthase
MNSSNKKGAQILVEQCLAQGMKHVVFSPGSRNAPFIIAFDEHPAFNCYVIHDERSAAFYALGMAQQLQEPVAVICTSGSAALNYYPAVAEAFYQCIPLVIITADRPNEWINQGDGQTIVQHEIYKNHIRYSCNFSEEIRREEDRWYLERELATAFNYGNGTWKGPIHFNMSFREPLYELEEVQEGKNTKIIESIQGGLHLNLTQKQRFAETWKASPRKMILCGQLPKDEFLLAQLQILASDSSLVVLVENTSNLVDSRFIHCVDRTLGAISENDLEVYSPDLLITLGGAVVSKRIKSFLRQHKVTQHWKVGHEFPYMDTYQSLTHTFECDPSSFLSELNSWERSLISSDFGSKWKLINQEVVSKTADFFSQTPYSDLSVFQMIISHLPSDIHLHMANSSVVRYCQLFDPISSISYWSNRGTSGIDGSSSTACGAAVAAPREVHTLITGDISFFYDSNAFWSNHLPPNLRVIVINNGGGGIFKIIPGPAATRQLDRYFVAEHSFSAEYLCKAFRLDYFQANSMEEVENQLNQFFEVGASHRPKVLEIYTPSDENDKVLSLYFDRLKRENM